MSILKKVFFLSLFLFFLAGLFWGVYNLSFKNSSGKSSPSKDDKSAPLQGGAPVSEPGEASEKTDKGKIMVISEEAVIAPSLSSLGDSLIYYGKNSGQANKIDFFGGHKEVIATQKFSNLENALWSADKTKTILKIKNGDKYSFKYFDFATNSIKDIKDNVDEVVWQTNANRIFYKYYDPATGAKTLNISDPDGSNWKKLADISYRKVSIAQIATTGMISFWNSEDSYSPTTLDSISVTGGERKSIFNGSFGADYLWDKTGERALISRADTKGGSKMQLGVINYNGGEYRNLDVPTFVSKCVWSKDGHTVYYALPGAIPDDAILPNDYKEGKFNTTDTFWKVDVRTGEKTRAVEVKDITSRYDASDLFFDQAESLLFFINRVDEKLYRIAL